MNDPVLVACEEKGLVTRALLDRGINAISCDLKPTRSDVPHHQGDIFPFIKTRRWAGIISFYECKYLANSGVRWLYAPDSDEEPLKGKPRWAAMRIGAKNFRTIFDAHDVVAAANSVMHGHAAKIVNMPFTQSFQPHHFGHKEKKRTCLWLKKLPKLEHTDVLTPPPTGSEEAKEWEVVHRMAPGPLREQLRSETKQGVADAMADQWGDYFTGRKIYAVATQGILI